MYVHTLWAKQCQLLSVAMHMQSFVTLCMAVMYDCRVLEKRTQAMQIPFLASFSRAADTQIAVFAVGVAVCACVCVCEREK